MLRAPCGDAALVPCSQAAVERVATMQDVGPDLERVGQVVEELFPEALGVWVYGSVADGTANEASDIDIAILGERPIRLGWGELERIGELSGRVGRSVDLVDLRSVPPLLQFEVFARGRRVVARDPTLCDRYETMAVSRYQRLNEERREIFEAIGQRGTVY
jgi:predicted nucleotidyltransferase